MNWFNRTRKRRIIKSISQDARISSALQDRLSGLDLPHLKAIEAARRRIRQKDARLTWAFAALLPRMVADVSISTELAKSDKRNIVGLIDKRIAESAKEIVDALPQALDPAPPPGCSLNRNALISVIIELLRKGKSSEEIGRLVLARVQEEPDRLLKGYSDWAKAQSEMVLAALEPNLRKSQPTGCSLDRGWCRKELVTLLRTHRDPEALVKAFVKRVGESFSAVYTGYDTALTRYEDEAQRIWGSVEQKLSTGAYNVVFNTEAIIRSIASRLLAGEKPAAIKSDMINIMTAQLKAYRSETAYSSIKSSSAGQMC